MVKLLPVELNSLNLESLQSASVYTVLTIPQNVTEMSANLKAPIIINNKTKMARQIVLQDSKLEVRFKMYMDLKKYIVNYTSDDSKRTNVNAPSKESAISVVAQTPAATANVATVKKQNLPEAN
jgi:flagellar assembly factor FliW